MLASLIDVLPRGDGWLYEVKWDGYRAIARVAGGEATLTSRNGNDLTGRFPTVARALELCRAHAGLRPGRRGVRARRGRARRSRRCSRGVPEPPTSTSSSTCSRSTGSRSSTPLIERRKRLEGLLDRRNRVVQLSEAFEDGEALLEAAREQLRGRRRETGRLALPPGEARSRLAEAEDAEPRRSSSSPATRRVRTAVGRVRLARPRRRGGRGARMGRQLRWGSPTRRSSGYCASSGRWSAATRHS